MMRRRAQGFTLIELLIVIAIISLLIALLLPSGQGIRDRVNRARCQAQLRGLANAYMAYVTTIGKHRFPPLWSTGEYIGNGQYAAWYYPQHDYRITVYGRFDTAFGPLIWHGFVRDSETFICPAIHDTGFEWFHDRDVPEGPDNFWSARSANVDPIEAFERYNQKHMNITNDHTRASYSIRPYLYPWSPSQVALNQGAKALMADNFPVPECVLERHRDAVNVAYLDGSVQYVTESMLWDNDMSWGFVPNLPTVMEIWQRLDQAQ